MKSKKLILLTTLLALTSCSGTITSPKNDRASSLTLNGDSFKVLQLTDIHFTYSTNLERESSFITASVNYANPDLIVVTGDSMLNASKGVVDALFSMFDSWKKPYYFIFGNHELQGFYSESWLMSKIYSSDYCLNVKMGTTSTSGHCDNVLNITKDDKTFFQIYTLDTHNSDNIGGTYYYDYIKNDQIEWYEKEAKKAKENNDGINVPSLGFIHIPLWEVVDAYVANKNGIIGEIHESATFKKAPEIVEKAGGPVPFFPSVTYAPFFPKAQEYGMKGIFFGHDHSNDWVGEYNGVAIGYGVKADRQLYYGVSNKGNEMIGGALYTIKDDASYSIKHFYLDYETHKVNEEKEVNRP